MARRRDYARERARRDQLANQRGFGSYAEQRRFVRRPRSPEQLIALPERAQEVRKDPTAVLDRARGRRDVEAVASDVGVPIAAVRWWGDEALGKTKRGRTPVTGRDIARLRFVIFEEGVEPVAVRGWKRREVERIFDIQWRALSGGATQDELRGLRGRKVGGRSIVDDIAQLRELGRRGLVDPGEWYREWQL